MATEGVQRVVCAPAQFFLDRRRAALRIEPMSSQQEKSGITCFFDPPDLGRRHRSG